MPSNPFTSYTSLKILNKLVEICEKIILEKIVLKINETVCFIILADETTDISDIEQFSLCSLHLKNQQRDNFKRGFSNLYFCIR